MYAAVSGSPFTAAGTLQTFGGIAIDGAGNVWFANSNSFTGVSELVGIAAPVVTPIVANLIAPYSTHASRP